MTPNVMFTCTSLAGTNKRGILTPDANGYYSQPIGALRVYNSAGHFYTDDAQAVALFKESSGFMRRVNRGAVRAEVDHPEWKKGMTDAEYEARMYYIDPKNTCAHFAQITLDFNNFKDEQGRPIIAIIGAFTPSGPHGAMLEKQLKNGLENVCFSIRAFTLDRYVGRVRHRTLAEIINFDLVNEPGINNAEKYRSLTLESHVDRPVTRSSVERALSERTTLNMGLESHTLDKDALFRSLGWSDAKDPGFNTKW